MEKLTSTKQYALPVIFQVGGIKNLIPEERTSFQRESIRNLGSGVVGMLSFGMCVSGGGVGGGGGGE